MALSTAFRRTHIILPEEVTGYAFDPARSWWSSIVAESSVNLVKNPSFELLNGSDFVDEYTVSGTWDDLGADQVVITYPVVGAPAGRRAARLVGASGTGTLEYDDAIAVTPGVYTFSLELYVEDPTVRVTMAVMGSGPTVIAQRSFLIDRPGWQRLHLSYKELATSTRTLRLQYVNAGSFAVTMWTDAWQFENKPYPTTYLDGDMIGFQDVGPYTSYFWHGAPHSSASTRIANTGSGGRLVSWSDFAGFRTTSIVGLMMPPFEQEVQTLANGKQIHRGSRAQTRDFTITGRIFAENPSLLLRKHNELERLLRPNNTASDDQLIVRYQQLDDGEHLIDKPLDIICVYNDGLRGGITNFYQEALALQFQAVQPALMDVYETSAELALVAELENNNVLFRDEFGEYHNLGTGDTTGGVVVRVGFLADGRMVAFGNYTDLAGSGAEFGAIWNGTTWEEIPATNGGVLDIDDGFKLGYPLTIALQNGQVHVYDPVAETWSILGGGDWLGPINSIARDINGDVWIGGDFDTSQTGFTTYNNLARYNAEDAAWETLGDGVVDTVFPADSEVNTIVVPNDGYVYIGGNFSQGESGATTTFGFNAIRWNIATEVYEAMGLGLDEPPNQFLYGQDGYIYAVGPFTKVGNDSYDLRGFARWNGYSWEEVFPLLRPGGVYGADGFIQDEEGIFWFYNLVNDTDDYFSVEGLGDVPFFGWRNGVFYPPYIANATIRHMAIGPGNRAIHATQEHGSGSPPMSVPAMTRINYEGSATAPVVVRFEGPGWMNQVRSYTTEGGVYGRNTFQMSANESVSLRNDMQRTLFYSNQRRNLYNKLIGGATNMAALRLVPGENRISVFVPDAVEDETEAWLVWKNRYWAIGENL